MRDVDIRPSLRRLLHLEYRRDPNSVIVEEIGLCQGTAIVDLLVINGFLHGYEIKSQQDKLDRLFGQEEVYNKTLDRVTIVASERHIEKLLRATPTWWGVWKASYHNKAVQITEVRRCKDNPNVDPMALVQLLWRDEAIVALARYDLHRGLIRRPRTELWKKLVESLPVDDLRKIVAEKLKSRQGWRYIDLRAPSGG